MKRSHFKPTEFFEEHPIFRTDQFLERYVKAGHTAATGQVLLSYHVRKGNLRRVRQGIYTTSPDAVDPWLIAAAVSPDGFLAYEGALSFHGLAGLHHSIPVIAEDRFSKFSYQDVVYARVQPTELKERDVLRMQRSGQRLRVTSVTRSLVDVLDRTDLSPEPIELWNAFETTRKEVDPAEAVDFALKLGRAATCARLGFFLEAFGAPQVQLRRLEAKSPPGSTYLQRKMIIPVEWGYSRRWKLIAPRDMTNAAVQMTT